MFGMYHDRLEEYKELLDDKQIHSEILESNYKAKIEELNLTIIEKNNIIEELKKEIELLKKQYANK